MNGGWCVAWYLQLAGTECMNECDFKPAHSFSVHCVREDFVRVESSTTCVFERNTMFKGGMGGKEGVGGGQAGVCRHGCALQGS